MRAVIAILMAALAAPAARAVDSEAHTKVKLCGQDEVRCADVISSGGKNRLPVEIMTSDPAFVARSNRVIAAGSSVLTTYTMSEAIALMDFHLGGRGPGQASVMRINDAATELVTSGDFESSGDVSAWLDTSIGDSLLSSWSYSTAQFYTGAGSAAKTFAKSDSNNYPEISYTWSTPKDVSAWRYVSAYVRVTVAAGGAQTRTASIILTDTGGATRTYSLSGTTTTAPFSTEQWLQVLGEIESPTSSTGTFDPYNVASIKLRLVDGGNKTGTIYWDNVRFNYGQTVIERIYVEANRTFQLILNPVELFSVGEKLGLRIRNNDTVAREFTATAKGVAQ